MTPLPKIPIGRSSSMYLSLRKPKISRERGHGVADQARTRCSRAPGRGGHSDGARSGLRSGWVLVRRSADRARDPHFRAWGIRTDRSGRPATGPIAVGGDRPPSTRSCRGREDQKGSRPGRSRRCRGPASGLPVPLTNYVAPIVPARLGSRLPDAALAAFSDRVSIFYAAEGAWPSPLTVSMADVDQPLSSIHRFQAVRASDSAASKRAPEPC